MRVLFIFNLAITNPLFLELVHRINDAGFKVIVYDFISSQKYDPVTRITSPIQSYWWASAVLKIRFIRRLFIPIINKKCIKDNFGSNDIVNFHFINKGYLQYIDPIKRQHCKIVSTIWGSDYLTSPPETLEAFKYLFQRSDLITMVKGLQEPFLKNNLEFIDKVKSTFFGLSQLDYINKVGKNDLISFKVKFNIPDNKISITIGYNGSPSQQHLKMINVIKALNNDVKPRVQLFIPLTYGGDREYRERLKLLVKELGITYTIFESRLNDVELAQMRCASDIVLNIQKTDAFSGSLAESLAAGNLLIVGDWLPYELYDEWGVKIVRSNEAELLSNLEFAIETLNNWSESAKLNNKIVSEKLSWNSTIKLWSNIFTQLKMT